MITDNDAIQRQDKRLLADSRDAYIRDLTGANNQNARLRADLDAEIGENLRLRAELAEGHSIVHVWIDKFGADCARLVPWLITASQKWVSKP